MAVAAALTLQPAHPGRSSGSRVDALAIRKVRPDPGARGRLGDASPGASCGGPCASSSRRWALLLLLGTPFLHVRFNSPDATILPESVPSRASYEILVQNFGEGAFAPLTLAVRTTGRRPTRPTSPALYDYSRRLAADPRVTRVDSLVDLDPRIEPGPVPAALREPGRTARPLQRRRPWRRRRRAT